MGRLNTIDRRVLLAGLAASLTAPGMALAQDYIDLAWSDLAPKGQTLAPRALQSMIDHSQPPPLVSLQPESKGVRTEWNGQIVKLPGFVVPIEYSGTGVTAFILVPFAGACVHVPPPPANQLVFVTTQDPYETSGLFEPVNVIGMFGISAMSTQLADIAYALSADKIERYTF